MPVIFEQLLATLNMQHALLHRHTLSQKHVLPVLKRAVRDFSITTNQTRIPSRVFAVWFDLLGVVERWFIRARGLLLPWAHDFDWFIKHLCHCAVLGLSRPHDSWLGAATSCNAVSCSRESYLQPSNASAAGAEFVTYLYDFSPSNQPAAAYLLSEELWVPYAAPGNKGSCCQPGIHPNNTPREWRRQVLWTGTNPSNERCC